MIKIKWWKSIEISPARKDGKSTLFDVYKGLVPDGTKPLHQSMLTKTNDVLSHPKGTYSQAQCSHIQLQEQPC